MTGPRPRSPDAVLRLAPLVLVVVAEAAWISVIGGLLQAFVLRGAVLGPAVLAVFVVAGIAAGRLLGPRLGGRWPLVALGLVAAAAVSGVTMSGEARDAAATGPFQAFAAHPGGLIAGLAVLRGFAHTQLPLAEETVTHLLAIGIPGLAIASLVGGLISEPVRSHFLGESLAAAIAFIASAALALAFARLDVVGQDGDFDWRRNPPWLVLAILILLGAIVVAIPLAAVAGTIVSVAISVALLPLLLLGMATGLDRFMRRLVVSIGLIALAVLVVGQLFARRFTPGSESETAQATIQDETANQIMTIGVGTLVIVGMIVAVVVLAAMWMRRSVPPATDVEETRSIDATGLPERIRRRSRWTGLRSSPRTAVEAYVALVDDLDRRPDARRDIGETPAAHAARMRASGRSGLALDLLAADYGLARFGDVALSEREDARGVERWRRLRRSLTRSRPGTGATAADASVPIAGSEAPEGTRTGLRAG